MAHHDLGIAVGQVVLGAFVHGEEVAGVEDHLDAALGAREDLQAVGLPADEIGGEPVVLDGEHDTLFRRVRVVLLRQKIGDHLAAVGGRHSLGQPASRAVGDGCAVLDADVEAAPEFVARPLPVACPLVDEVADDIHREHAEIVVG